MIGFGDPEGEAAPTLGQRIHPVGLLLVGAVGEHEQQADVVADDRVLVLQVAVQAEASTGEVLTDHRHAEVVPSRPPYSRWERVAVVAGRVGTPPGLGEERLPVGRRQPARSQSVRASLATVVEEAHVVVRLLKGADLLVDEVVELSQVVGQLAWDVEVHAVTLARPAGSRSRCRRRVVGRGSIRLRESTRSRRVGPATLRGVIVGA